MSNQNKDKRTVSEKIEDLENAMINAYEIMNNMSRDLAAAKEGASLLGMKTQAIIDVLQSGASVSNDSVVSQIQSLRIDRMASDVAGLVKRGALTSSDTVTERSFIVGRDLAKDGSGTVVNPRLQFVLNSLDDLETKNKFLGSKVGDVLTFSENGNRFEIQEVYSIGVSDSEDASEGESEEVAG